MYLYELEKGEEVTLTIKMKNSEKFEYRCPVVEVSVKGNCILVPPLKFEGKILKFDQEKIFAEVIVIRDNKPIIFRGCFIQYIKTKENTYHAIICKNIGANLNRRSHYRVSIDEYCYVNHGKATIDAMCLDMSSAGFSFLVGHYDGQEMDFVHMIYRDRIVDADINVMGRVVRRVDREDGKTLFGCYMIPRADVDKYLSTRQRKTMKPKDINSSDDKE